MISLKKITFQSNLYSSYKNVTQTHKIFRFFGRPYLNKSNRFVSIANYFTNTNEEKTFDLRIILEIILGK